jgi:hypothetical protein
MGAHLTAKRPGRTSSAGTRQGGSAGGGRAATRLEWLAGPKQSTRALWLREDAGCSLGKSAAGGPAKVRPGCAGQCGRFRPVPACLAAIAAGVWTARVLRR